MIVKDLYNKDTARRVEVWNKDKEYFSTTSPYHIKKGDLFSMLEPNGERVNEYGYISLALSNSKENKDGIQSVDMKTVSFTHPVMDEYRVLMWDNEDYRGEVRCENKQHAVYMYNINSKSVDNVILYDEYNRLIASRYSPEKQRNLRLSDTGELEVSAKDINVKDILSDVHGLPVDATRQVVDILSNMHLKWDALSYDKQCFLELIETILNENKRKEMSSENLTPMFEFAIDRYITKTIN